MKKIEELGISPWPWECEEGDETHFPVVFSSDFTCQFVLDGDNVADNDNARLIAAAPELYDALLDCCEEVNGHDAPRCYGCRRGEDGHCMARGVCKIYKALTKASGESEVAK